MRFITRAICAFSLSLIAMPAFAAATMDCSKGAMPSGALKGAINGAAFVPDSVTVDQSTTSMNNINYDSYHLFFKNKAGGEFDTTAIVVKGKLPDGKTFHMVAGNDEPEAGNGAPEVQGWQLADKKSNYDHNFVFDTTATMQLSFGKRSGNSLPGQIHFCTPADKGSSLAGSFAVTVK